MIVFPMAGLSRRFTDQGYQTQKFMLPLWSGTVFDYAVSSFDTEFEETPFLFIYRETGEVLPFIKERVAALGIRQARYVRLDQPTAGQAETVEFGLDSAVVPVDEALTIFNIDSFRMPGIQAQGLASDLAGWLEVFRGSGENWSFVQASDECGLAAKTAEKIAISDLCCTGLYNFSSAALFREALAYERESPGAKELYIAPIYNHLIAQGERIGYSIVDVNDVVFCGVPEEYEALQDTPSPYDLAGSNE